ncbi:hypothetical protein P2G88_19390 [Aliiglaciecola sp. CAU 1673]|uniref:hypothetical protein n=1 Tax=Aliiglaciecola sp. CAU 1673 TaxID=3032595 RepID=UPI0023DA3B43|nr:hypothetical protein [Aliiglaciecola sp. CAU 1673]MDF2180424.1 hypothetical protein [Aliiglaciecola sp. CAU 1673]
MEKFRVRPAYQSDDLLIEFRGDHRSRGYPNIRRILEVGLSSKPKKHPSIDTAMLGASTDEFISLWEYENGEYELDDDVWAYFILAPDNNARVISDIVEVLLKSGEFIREETDPNEYT